MSKKINVGTIGHSEPILAPIIAEQSAPIVSETSPEVQKMQEVVANKVSEAAGKAEMERILNTTSHTYHRGPKIGRNQPCPCGKLNSNNKPLKYKKCCGK